MPPGLLQRGAELAALERHLQRARAGDGRVCVVDGPAGVGKSSLLRAAARTADGSGFGVLRAWAGPLEQQAGWGVVRQLFGPVATGPDRATLDVGAAALARRVLDPDPGAPAPTGDAAHAASYGLTWLAYGLAERRPLLLVVDDVHWADSPSIRWLAQLGRQLAELRLCVLCAVRSGEPATEPRALAELVAAAPEPPLRPRPLGPDAVATLVMQRLPTADPTFAPACHAASAGNPFLLGALLDQLVAEEVAPTADVAARLSAFGTEQVAHGVELQLSRMAPGATGLARGFAVLGRGTPLRLAADLAGLDLTEAAGMSDHLLASGLLEDLGEGYTLAHPLVAAALYRGMPAGERSSLHRRAAALLTADRAEVEAVGLHLLHSEPAAEPATVGTLRGAAARANLRGAPGSAVLFLERALREPPADLGLAADLHSELGLSLAAEVRPGAREHLDLAVDEAATPGQRLRLALSGTRALGLAGHFDHAVELARRGLQPLAAGDDDEHRGELELELVCNLLLGAETVEEARALVAQHEGRVRSGTHGRRRRPGWP